MFWSLKQYFLSKYWYKTCEYYSYLISLIGIFFLLTAFITIVFIYLTIILNIYIIFVRYSLLTFFVVQHQIFKYYYNIGNHIVKPASFLFKNCAIVVDFMCGVLYWFPSQNNQLSECY